ncbi:MAG: 3D domain-containing protein [Acidobacteria bacterium]|nr:3D domain-containing protein [Acidobacteriota bacterium]
MSRAALALCLGLAAFTGACATGRAVRERPAPRGGERVLVVTATAYNSTPAQTHGDPHDGAWGHRIVPGMRVVAVSPDLERLGLVADTRVRIAGLPGTYTVLDRMPSHRRRAIDVYMGNDVAAARKFGRRRVEIRWRAPRAGVSGGGR